MTVPPTISSVLVVHPTSLLPALVAPLKARQTYRGVPVRTLSANNYAAADLSRAACNAKHVAYRLDAIEAIPRERLRPALIARERDSCACSVFADARALGEIMLALNVHVLPLQRIVCWWCLVMVFPGGTFAVSWDDIDQAF